MEDISETSLSEDEASTEVEDRELTEVLLSDEIAAESETSVDNESGDDMEMSLEQDTTDGSRVQFATSQRGRRMVIHSSHIYHFKRKLRGGQEAWMCERSFWEEACKGRIQTMGDEIVKVVTAHNHLASAVKAELRTVIGKMCAAAKVSTAPPQSILAQHMKGVSREAQMAMSSESAVKKRLYTVRARAFPDKYVGNPNQVKDLIIPDNIRTIVLEKQQQDFLMFDTKQNILPERMLVFSTVENLKLLTFGHEWQSDGTFDNSPKLFKQLYSIHVIYKGKSVPVVNGLMTNKTASSYALFFDAVKKLALHYHGR